MTSSRVERAAAWACPRHARPDGYHLSAEAAVALARNWLGPIVLNAGSGPKQPVPLGWPRRRVGPAAYGVCRGSSPSFRGPSKHSPGPPASSSSSRSSRLLRRVVALLEYASDRVVGRSGFETMAAW